MPVQFTDNSIKVKAAINDTMVAWLYEAAAVIESEAARNTRVGKVGGGQTKGKWKHVVDESKMEATVGNTEENAIWEEMGTGEYALEGKGRKGGWYIPIGDGSGQISQQVVDAYHMKVVYGKDGKKFAYTEGKKPQRMLHKAFTAKKAKIIKSAQERMKGLK